MVQIVLENRWWRNKEVFPWITEQVKKLLEGLNDSCFLCHLKITNE